MKSPQSRLVVFFCVFLAAVTWALGQERPMGKPNIVILLADDMGHGDVGCLNPQSKIATPNIDRLASQGIAFTDAHSGSAVCSPTRYGVLTGRYAWRTRLIAGALAPYDPPLIEADRLTLPGMLRQQGYHTACIGKWHLGWDWSRKDGKSEPDFTQVIANGPITRGFSYYFGVDVANYPPYCFLENDRTVGLPTATRTQHNLDGWPGAWLPGWKFDAILPTLTERAVGYLQQRAADKQPFLLYFPLTSPHQPIAPSEAFRGKSELNPLADFIIETDAVVGKVVDTVDRLGLADQTLIFFTADNGAGYHYSKEMLAAGQNRNGPFRGCKEQIYEGGHRVPFFARWPGKIAPGTRSDETICLTDFMATVAAILGVPLPNGAAEDSYSILPALLGEKRDRPIREATVHQAESGQLAIRQGPWKLILAEPDKRPARGSQVELYNLVEDVAETKNLADQHPEIVQRLSQLIEQYRVSGRSRP